MRPISILGFILAMASPLLGQETQDHVLAGKRLLRLKDAMADGLVSLQNNELRNQIYYRNLSAIIIPKEQPHATQTHTYIIRRCAEIKSVFDEPDLELDEPDYKALLEYSKGGDKNPFAAAMATHQAIEAGDPVAKSAATLNLENSLKSLPSDRAPAARRFAGALMADLEPSEPFLSQLVGEHRRYIEEKTARSLGEYMSQGRPNLEIGQPFTIGDSGLSVSDLSKVHPAEVRHFSVEGFRFNAAWIGENFVITPQAQMPANKFADDPTGLGMSFLGGGGAPSCGAKAPRIRKCRVKPLEID